MADPFMPGYALDLLRPCQGICLREFPGAKPLKVQPPDMKRLSAPVATTCPAKPALKRASVDSRLQRLIALWKVFEVNRALPEALPVDAEFRRNRRVSFTETPETRDVSPVSRSHGEAWWVP